MSTGTPAPPATRSRFANIGNIANRLYRGEAGINVVGRRRRWFAIAGLMLLLAILSFTFRQFTFGIEFRGGNQFIVPASVGTLSAAEDATASALAGKQTRGEPAEVVSAQVLRGAQESTYMIRTTELTSEDTTEVKERLARDLGVPSAQISDDRVSSAWGSQVTRQALIGLGIFLVLVIIYLIFRFEWRMAVAAVASLALDLVLTAGVYSLIGFEVTPSTIIGFLTILGFALYDVVVVFDKVQENTRGITASSLQTYGDAANLAVNQTLMRSINTGLVALLPVGGLLFIGAGLLGAGTLKDLGLVLFVGMGTAVYSSIFFATPVLVTLKEQEPRIKAHTQRVLARRAAGPAARAPKQPAKSAAAAKAGSGEGTGAAAPQVGALAGAAAPRPGARAGGKPGAKRGGGKGGPRGGRPGGAKRR